MLRELLQLREPAHLSPDYDDARDQGPNTGAWFVFAIIVVLVLTSNFLL